MARDITKIPVIDLFAGPGGLGEGFSAYACSGEQPFQVKLSIEKDPAAYRTLQLRSFFHKLPQNPVPDAYYDYLRRVDVSEDERRKTLFDQYPEKAEQVEREACLAELGKADDSNKIHKWIQDALAGYDEWVLIGGPPCQAYSIAGRSRNRGNDDYDAEKDHRQYLYLEYLQIIAEYQPSIFVMENVKGLLSATLKNQYIFERMCEDLRKPEKALKRENRPVRSSAHAGRQSRYKLYSLVKLGEISNVNLSDFVVPMEKFGIPQARHRVIILGIREDIYTRPKTLEERSQVSARKVLDGLPEVRSGLSREEDSNDAWRNELNKMAKYSWFESLQTKGNEEIYEKLSTSLKKIRHNAGRGDEFMPCDDMDINYEQEREWFLDSRIEGVCNHITRGHIVDDLYRYFYAACFAEVKDQSPKLKDFPVELLPAHKNAKRAANGSPLFVDRFRVQLSDNPATTVTSHISKDGHYYIHYDPTQCRSLTVREAARLQTFPDNYFFCGPRTSQYVQVGNAVPPLLARQIADVVHDVLKRDGRSILGR